MDVQFRALADRRNLLQRMYRRRRVYQTRCCTLHISRHKPLYTIKLTHLNDHAKY